MPAARSLPISVCCTSHPAPGTLTTLPFLAISLLPSLIYCIIFSFSIPPVLFYFPQPFHHPLCTCTLSEVLVSIQLISSKCSLFSFLYPLHLIFPFSLFNFLPPALLLFFNLQPNMPPSLLTSPPTPCKGPCGRVRQGQAGRVWLTVWRLQDKLWDLSCVFRTECWKLGTSLWSYVSEAVPLSVVTSCCLSLSPLTSSWLVLNTNTISLTVLTFFFMPVSSCVSSILHTLLSLPGSLPLLPIWSPFTLLASSPLFFLFKHVTCYS